MLFPWRVPWNSNQEAAAQADHHDNLLLFGLKAARSNYCAHQTSTIVYLRSSKYNKVSSDIPIVVFYPYKMLRFVVLILAFLGTAAPNPRRDFYVNANVEKGCLFRACEFDSACCPEYPKCHWGFLRSAYKKQKHVEWFNVNLIATAVQRILNASISISK